MWHYQISVFWFLEEESAHVKVESKKKYGLGDMKGTWKLTKLCTQDDKNERLIEVTCLVGQFQ
jgi:hypothetical protein